MPFVRIPPGVNSVVIRRQDPIQWVEYDKHGRVFDSGVDLTGNYSYESGRVIRSGGKPVTIGGKLWKPVRAYTRSARRAWWSGGSVQIRTSGATAQIGNIRVDQGIPGASSVWSPCSYLPESVSTTSSMASGNGINSLNTNGRNRINTQLLVKAGKRKVDYGEALGESRQTVRMIAQTLIQMVRFVKALRKGQFRHAAGILGINRRPTSRSISENWLALQYGWQPLLSDIYDSCKLLQTGLTKGPQLFSVQSWWSETERTSVSHASFRSSTTETTVLCGGKLWYRIADQTISGLSQMGLLNPAEVAWAIVPWSFVIDWFIPVGSFLEALSARVGLTFHDGYHGCRTTSRLRQTGCRQVASGFAPVTSTVIGAVDIDAYVRRQMSSLPWPGFYYKSPFSSTHVANALALLRTLRRG